MKTAIIAALIHSAQVMAACSAFRVVDQVISERGSTWYSAYRMEAGTAGYRVSEGFTCDAGHADSRCGVSGACYPTATDGTRIEAAGTFNVSQLNDDQDSVPAIFSLAATALNMAFAPTAETTLGEPGAAVSNVCIGHGQSVYLEFVPDFYCVQGVLSCDASSSVPDGTAIELCAPAASRDGNRQLMGSLQIVYIDQQAAQTLTDSPLSPTPVALTSNTPVPATPFPDSATVKFRKLRSPQFRN